MAIRVAIVEDETEVTEDLVQMLTEHREFTCVCACRTARSALRRIPSAAPDLVIMDIQLPDANGIECTSKLKRLMPDVQILMFTVSDDDEQIFRALQAGAVGYILKGSEPSRMLEALHEVRSGGAPLSGVVARKIVQSFARGASDPSTIEPLTRREEDVLGNLAKGCVSKEIAANLSISTETVNYHLKQIYQKLHVRSRTEAVIRYLKNWPSPPAQ